jgi:cytochrome bd-type quinol oxidase subunit 2
MKKYQKNLIIFLCLIVGLFIFYQVASASIFGGLESARKTAGFSEETSFEKRIGSLISIVLGFVGVIFLGLTFYGGFIWMAARGNEQEIEKAKRLIESAIIGLAIVFAAYAITYFVTERILSTTSGGGCTAGKVPCSCPGGTFCMDPSVWSGCDAFCAGEEP